MNILYKLRTFLWVGFCFSGCLLSCVDDTNEVGLELQNPDDKVFVFNDSTININTYTYQQYDLIYLNPTFLLLGYNNDEKLGQFENNFMTEVSLSSFDVDFGDNPVADSIILFLDYTYSYGDTTQTQNITIYELNKELSLNDTANSIHGRLMEKSVVSEYYNPKAIIPFPYQFNPNPNDSVPLKISLPINTWDNIFDTNLYTTQDVFSTNVFRGFYFVAEAISDGGAISYFNVGDSTRMILYYHNNKDTNTYLYNIDASSYKCNIFFRTPNPNIKSLPVETNPDANYKQDLFYIKNNNAFEGRIDITGLQIWADTLGYFSINKAVIDVYTEQPATATDSLYYPPSSLQVFRVDNDFNKIYLEEYFSSTEYNSIRYDSLSGGYGYQIYIEKTLYNSIQNGDSILSLVLTNSNQTNLSTANRYILKGSENSKKPVLNITYTKFSGK